MSATEREPTARCGPTSRTNRHVETSFTGIDKCSGEVPAPPAQHVSWLLVPRPYALNSRYIREDRVRRASTQHVDVRPARVDGGRMARRGGGARGETPVAACRTAPRARAAEQADLASVAVIDSIITLPVLLLDSSARVLVCEGPRRPWSALWPELRLLG